MFTQFIEFIDSKKVLILGFGREGRSTYGIIRRHLPEKEIGIADIKELEFSAPFTTLHTGKTYLESLKDYEVIIKTPGISFRDFIIPRDVIITCQTDLFLHFFKSFCVGITGTKGKTTVATLLYAMLKKAGKNACLIGNIGVPALEALEDGKAEIAIVEMSSHQLEFTTASPQLALLTNIYPEHLEHHNGFTGYVNSKFNIIKHQNSQDCFICNALQCYDGFCDFSKIPSTVIKVTTNISGYEKIYETVEFNEHLIGNHNIQNAFLATAAARKLGVSDKDICQAISEYGGIEHRLELVGTYNEIRFYNDALATIPQATIAGIEGIGNVDTLVLGGMSVGVDLDSFENYLFNSNVSNIIGLPDTGRQICIALANRSCNKNLILVEDMEQAVEKAFEITQKGKSCLMSPAASSYNVYKDFEHKGKHFKKLVQERTEEK